MEFVFPVRKIELTSAIVEKAVVDLINKFMGTVVQPDLQEHKYNWMDPERAVKPVGSTSKLLMGEDLGKTNKLTSRLRRDHTHS